MKRNGTNYYLYGVSRVYDLVKKRARKILGAYLGKITRFGFCYSCLGCCGFIVLIIMCCCHWLVLAISAMSFLPYPILSVASKALFTMVSIGRVMPFSMACPMVLSKTYFARPAEKASG